MFVSKRYKDYITSARWQAKRQAYFAKHGKRCQACFSGRGPIHVHHMDYSRLGNEHLSDLCGLCVSCHREVTRIYRANRSRGLRRVTMEFVLQKRAQTRSRKEKT